MTAEELKRSQTERVINQSILELFHEGGGTIHVCAEDDIDGELPPLYSIRVPGIAFRRPPKD